MVPSLVPSNFEPPPKEGSCSSLAKLGGNLSGGFSCRPALCGQGVRPLEILELAAGVYCLRQAVNVGIIAGDGQRAIVVDTGVDEGSGRRVLKALDRLGLQARVIINTHAHADHFGGNRALVAGSGAEVWAAAVEADVMTFPLWEPTYLFGGARPPQELRHKFLLAAGCPVARILTPGSPCKTAFAAIEVLALPGHSHNHLGISAGGVLFAGDTYLGHEALARHGIPYNFDVAAARASMETLLACQGDWDWVVPSHGEPVQDPTIEVRANLERLTAIETLIRETTQRPRTEAELLRILCDRFRVKPNGLGGHLLNSAALRAYLSLLADGGIVAPWADGGEVMWVRDLKDLASRGDPPRSLPR